MAEKTLPLYTYVAHERESPPPVGVLGIFVWHLRLLTIITNFIFSSVKKYILQDHKTSSWNNYHILKTMMDNNQNGVAKSQVRVKFCLMKIPIFVSKP